MAAQTTPPVSPSSKLPAVAPQISKPKNAAPGKPEMRPATKRPLNLGALPFWAGIMFSAFWVCVVLAIVAGSGPAHMFGGLPLVDWSIGISAIVSPVALIWMVTAYLQRAADIKSVADPLRRQLSIITGESGAAEARIRRFNQAIREQIDLLKNAQGLNQDDLSTVMERIRQHRDEMERFEHSSINQVKDIQEIVRRNMQQVEQLMDDKFTMLRVLDGKLVQNGDAVARQTEVVRVQVAGLLEEVESRSQVIADALERATSDSKKLADTSRVQESTLITTTENVAETLNNLSGKIDLSVARFLERAGSAREEAERLASALDTQTRSLDEFSNNLPARVGEAESVIRGVADRLYASEQMAREQAVILSEKLSQQVDGLQSFMDRFTARMSDIDGKLEGRRNDLDSLAGRIGDTTGEFVDAWEKSILDLNIRTVDTLGRFKELNHVTRTEAVEVSEHLATTTAQYETAAERMSKLSTESNASMKSMTAEIMSHLAQFEALGEASLKAGSEVEQRASTAMQNLQYVLERLLTAREATQSVGETLVKDLYAAVDQNEQLVTRLNEAAQMSVRALGIATESLGKQEGDLADRTRVAEATLKEAVAQLQTQADVAGRGLHQQAQSLMAILHETQDQMGQTEMKLKSLASTAVAPIQDAMKTIDTSTDQGLQSLSRYGDGLQGQFAQLQQFHARVGGMGEDLSRVTTETLGTIDQLNNRFIAVRTMQEETARQTLDQFADLSDRLQREVKGLDGQTSQAVHLLQEAAAKVGEQSYQLLQNAENSGAKMQLVTTALQNEATQARSILQKQADDLGSDLSRAEKQFATLGEVLKQRTDAAYSLLDRVSAHYNETTRAASQDLEARTERLDQATTLIQGKTESMTAALASQLNALTTGTVQLDAQAAQISASGGKAMQQLSSLNEKMTMTGETSNAMARQIVQRLEESGTAFLRQSNALTEAAQTSAALVQKAASTFGEQAGKLLDSSHHIDQNLRQLTAATSSFADQSTQIRNAMEQQNQRLVTQLTDSVAQLENTSNKLELTASTASLTADQASARFNDMTQNASTRLGASHSELQTLATKADTMLTSLGSNINHQATALGALSDQLTEQYRLHTTANDSQRTQLVDLFEKLGASHGQASEVAERTITRLSDSLNQIQRSLGALSDQSQTAVGNVRAASTGFADQSAVLIQNAQQAEQQARTVVTVTEALQNQARQLREAMQDESQRAGDMLGSLLNRLSAGGVEIRDMSSTTDQALLTLQGNMSEQSQALNTTMVQIADRQRALTAALDAQRDVLNGLLSRLNLAQDETASVAERTAARLGDSSTQIARQIDLISTQTQTVMTVVQDAGSVFAAETRELIQNAQNAEQQARSVMGTTATLQEQGRQLREAMHEESVRAGDTLTALLGKLSTGGAEIRDMSATANNSLNELHGNMSEQAQTLTASMQQINDRQRTLTTSLDAQRDVLNGLLSRLNLAQDETASVAERSAARLADSSNQIMRQTEALSAQAQSTLTSVQDAGSVIVNESTNLIQNAQSAEQQARSVVTVTTALQDQARQLREALNGESDRASDVLGKLLKLLSAGGVELRDMSSSTEMSLHSLNNGVTQQAQSLNTVMQQIAERQRSLTTALDAQRDVLNGLLSRLNLAQDETAASVERTASRITESAQQVARQADVIESQAQNALASVQASGVGFADQAGTLSVQAQQAEQQMRGVLSVTAGLSDQARLLRESMQAESARAVEALNATIAQIDASNGQLKQQSTTAIHTMDQTALQFASLAHTSAEAMARQAGILSETAEMAEGRMADASEKMRGNLKLVSDVGEQAEVQARQLADSAEYATNRLVTLRETINDSDRDGQTVLTQTSARITDVKALLHSELERLADLSQQAVLQVLNASQGLLSQSDNLRSNLAMSESALAQAADLVRQETVQLPATLDRSTSQIEMATRVLKAQTEEADNILVGTADRFISVTMTARESMMEEMRRVSSTAENADKILTQFNSSLAEQMVAIQHNTNQLSEEQRELVAKATDSVAQLSQASDRLARLRSDALETAQKLAHEFDTIDQRASSTSDRLAQSSETLIKNTTELSQVTQRAETQMLGASSQFREQLERIRTGLQVQIDDINRGLMQITAQLERTGTTLRSTTSSTVADVERIAQRYDQTSKDASMHLTEKTARMRGATEEVASLLTGFGDQLDVLLDRLAMAGDGIRRQEGGMVEQLQQALNHLGGVAERLESSRSLANNVSEQTAQRLGEVVETVQREMQTLTSSSQAAAGIMRGVGQIYSEQTQNLNTGVREAHGTVLAMNKSVDEMQQRTDRMRVSLKLQGEDLMNSLQQILNQLSETGDALGETVDQTLRNKAASELQKIG